jgi:hypothetical protein
MACGYPRGKRGEKSVKKFIVLTLLLAVSAVTAGVAVAENTNSNGSDKATLYAQHETTCSLFPIYGEDGTATDSFAVMQYDKAGNVVKAKVVLKGATPNKTYMVRILQGDSTSCFTDLGSITTNGKGNGAVSVSAPSTSSRAAAFVCDVRPAAPAASSSNRGRSSCTRSPAQ